MTACLWGAELRNMAKAHPILPMLGCLAALFCARLLYEATGRDAVKSVLALCLMGLLLMPDTTEAAEYEVTTRTNIEYVQHDGVALPGDLYLPKGLEKAPVLVAVHGGGWQTSSRANYQYWGPY